MKYHNFLEWACGSLASMDIIWLKRECLSSRVLWPLKSSKHFDFLPWTSSSMGKYLTSNVLGWSFLFVSLCFKPSMKESQSRSIDQDHVILKLKTVKNQVHENKSGKKIHKTHHRTPLKNTYKTLCCCCCFFCWSILCLLFSVLSCGCWVSFHVFSSWQLCWLLVPVHIYW